MAAPTGGQNGEDGQQGLPGFDRKDGGNAGSFHLKAFQMSDFRLTDVQNNPGEGSKGGQGSSGGYGGYSGEETEETTKNFVVTAAFQEPKPAKAGKKRPSWEKWQKTEKKEPVCLEKLSQKRSFLLGNWDKWEPYMLTENFKDSQSSYSLHFLLNT